jgi:hypothetical protein
MRVLSLLFVIILAACSTTEPHKPQPLLVAKSSSNATSDLTVESALVQQYLSIASFLGRSPNTAIVDLGTEDFLATLTPDELDRATWEVALMATSQSNEVWSQNQQFVNRINQKDAEIDALAGSLESTQTAATSAAASAAAAQSSALDAETAAEQASQDAAAAQSTAQAAQSTANGAASTATAAQSTANSAATAATAAQTAAAAAQTAADSAAAAANAVTPRLASIRATNLTAINVPNGSGTTAIPFPNAIEAAPFTSGVTVSISAGALQGLPAGVYEYTFDARFTSTLLAAGVFRFFVTANGRTTGHAQQYNLLGIEAGVNGTGRFVIPPGGANVTMSANHNQVLGTGASVTFTEFNFAVKRVGS